ncbi:phosphate ABC transporter substrate-binding protein PstS [uncultured Enterovirga sp.]|uniref:phosphate ABC transporter substrate-binding protein PstS n=1 Tax=uncultured Enterovirga sp. TaxID=2026352 RepID=UPI0035CC5451
MRRSTFVAVLAAALAGAAVPVAAQEMSGAGSTFAYPVLSQWSKAYQRSQTDAEFQPVGTGLDYEPVGSQAGIMRLRDGAVDFGATDVPLGADELGRFGLGQFPIVIGGIVAALNLDGVPAGRLKLTGELLADIYLGQVKTWQDPAIRALNPDLTLPDAAIAVLRRSDGSGTTFNFTNYLSRQSPVWKEKVGEGLLVTWPTGAGAKGNDGMAEAVKATRNAIGYVDFAQAQRAKLAFALLRNRAGQFVQPGPDSFQASAAGANWAAAPGFDLLLNDAPGETAYPIIATTFAVMKRQTPPTARARAVFAFLRWSLDDGAKDAQALGYVPLPPALVTQIKGHWSSAFGLDR